VGRGEPRGCPGVARWEWRFVKFLELTGVGRTVADGTDEDGAHAARMDGWVAWKTKKTGAPGKSVFLSFFILFSFVRGTPAPESCALEGDGFP